MTTDKVVCTDFIVEKVREKLLQRSIVGQKKYNTTIFDNIDDNYVQHLSEELLDAANYCEQVMRLGKFTQNIIKLIKEVHTEQELGKNVIKEYYRLLEEK